MEAVKIMIDNNGGYTLSPNPVQLGGTHSHQLVWFDDTTQQAIVTSLAFDSIFSNPPSSGQIVVGGDGHRAPKPPLELLPHDKRHNGTFDYTVTIGGDPVSGKFQVHP